MTPEHFVSHWTGRLVRVPVPVAVGIRIPDSSFRFLTQAGLPSLAPLGPGLSFDSLADGMPELCDSMQNRCPANLTDARVLGSGGHDRRLLAAIAVPTGSLWLVSTYGGEAMFLNSSVEQLAECLLAFHVLLENRSGESPAILSTLLERTLTEIDRSVFGCEISFWPDRLVEVLAEI